MAHIKEGGGRGEWRGEDGSEQQTNRKLLPAKIKYVLYRNFFHYLEI